MCVRLTRTAVEWARARSASVTVAGTCGGSSRLTMGMLGESIVLVQAPGRDADVALVGWPDPGQAPPPAKVLARRVRTPRDLHRALRRSGYS